VTKRADDAALHEPLPQYTFAPTGVAISAEAAAFACRADRVGLRRASGCAGDASVDSERVGAGGKDLLALAVSPYVPGGAVVAQER
jgi:hypothetical protein